MDSAWDEFNWATKAGVEKLQDHLGVDQTGRAVARATWCSCPLPPGSPRCSAHSAVPRRVRCCRRARRRGRSASRWIRTCNPRSRPVTEVTITLPDGSTTPGRVTSVGKVATAPSTLLGRVRRRADGAGARSGPPIRGPPAAWTRRLVEVAITDQTVHNVLAVPVTALLARAGGGTRWRSSPATAPPPGAGQAGAVRRRSGPGAGIRSGVEGRTARGGARQ